MSSETFDPAAVPVYPSVRLSLIRGQVAVDDEPVTVPVGMTPQQAGVRIVAARAAAREGSIQAIQAVASDEAGHTWRMVIDAAGQVWPLTESGASLGTARASPRNGQKRVGVRVAVLGTAVVLVGGGLGGLIAAHHSHSPAPHPAVTRTVTPTATPTELPVAAPVGWSPQALWSSGPVAAPDSSQQSTAAAAVSGNFVYTVRTSGDSGLSLAALSTRTGAPVWSNGLNGSSVTQGPVLGRVAGVPVVMVATDTAVSAWSLQGKRLGDWPVPTVGTGDTAVALTPAGPIIPRSQTTVSIVGLGGKLVTRALPPGGRAVAILAGDTLLVTDTGGHAWKVTSPTVAGNPVTLPAPKGWTGGTTVAVTGTTLIQQWTPAKATSTGAVLLRATALNGLRPGWTSAAINTQNAASPLLVSPSGTVGVLGSAVVDLHTGGLRDLPVGWTAQLAGDRVIWCTNADQQLVAASLTGAPQGGAPVGTPTLNNANGSTGATDPAIPAGTIGTSALVIGTADTTPRLYLLPSTAAATTPSSTSTPSSVPSTTAPPKPAKTSSTPAGGK